jgi:hypothetical protein
VIKIFWGLILIAIGPFAHSDELYKFIKPLCAAEAGYAKFDTLSVRDLSSFAGQNLQTMQEIINSNGWVNVDSSSTYECELPTGVLALEIVSMGSSASGACGSNRGGYLSLSFAGNKLIVDAPVHDSCFPPSLVSLEFQSRPKSYYAGEPESSASDLEFLKICAGDDFENKCWFLYGSGSFQAPISAKTIEDWYGLTRDEWFRRDG